MNVNHILAVSKTIEEYKNEGGTKTTLPEIIKDIRETYPTRTEWISVINNFTNPEEDGGNKPLNEAYKQVEDLFKNGFPSIKFPIPIPEETVAKVLDIANTTIEEGGPEVSELALNRLKLENKKIEAEMNNISNDPENNEPKDENNELNENNEPKDEDKSNEEIDEPTKGGSLYFTKEDCTFF